MSLQSPYDDPAMSPPEPGGDLATARGGDPNIDTGGSSGLSPLWSGERAVTDFGPQETPNSVSGLPGTPARFQPSEAPPSPPDLTDRSPGTIDQR